MKIHIIFIALLSILCSSSSLVGQKRKMRYKILYRHSFEPVITIYRGYNILENSSSDSKGDKLSSSYQGISQMYTSYGLNYGLSITHKLLFVTGIHFTNPAMKTNDLTEIDVIETRNSTQINQGGLLIRRNYVEIPTLARFTVSGYKACKSYIEIGMMHQLYTKSVIRQHSDGSAQRTYIQEKQDQYHKTAQLNIGSEFIIAKTLPFFTQLNMTYQLDPMEQGIKNDRNLAIGFTTGTRIRF